MTTVDDPSAFGVVAATCLLTYDTGTGKSAAAEALQIREVATVDLPGGPPGTKCWAFKLDVDTNTNGLNYVGSVEVIASAVHAYDLAILIDNSGPPDPYIYIYARDLAAGAVPVGIDVVAAALAPNFLGAQVTVCSAGTGFVLEP